MPVFFAFLTYTQEALINTWFKFSKYYIVLGIMLKKFFLKNEVKGGYFYA